MRNALTNHSQIFEAGGGYCQSKRLSNITQLRPLRVLSLFSGIGAFEKALENIGVPYELVGYCEIDKYASKAYSLIHNVPESMNFGDITKLNAKQLGNVDLVTYGFPCQDISCSGKQKGFVDEEGNRTRSGLFFEALRIVEETKPKFAICENVKALTGKKFKNEFQLVLDGLDEAGYNNYWKVLNAKDYGVPQNRERVFVVSIRKDIDDGFDFPDRFPLQTRLKDVLEDNVDEKFYLTEEQVAKLSGNIFHQANVRLQEKDWCDILLARDYKDPKCVRVMQIGNIAEEKNFSNPQVGRVYSPEGLSPTLNTCQGGGREPKIVDVELTSTRGNGIMGTIRASIYKQGSRNLIENVEHGRGYEGVIETIVYDDFNSRIRADQSCVGTITTNIGNDALRNGQKLIEFDPVYAASRGRYLENSSDTEQRLEVNLTGTTNTLTAVLKDDYIIEPDGRYYRIRIRKLTPKECFRLMGFDDEDCDILSENKISNTQIYKMAGNSIVVQVLEHIFKNLLERYT